MQKELPPSSGRALSRGAIKEHYCCEDGPTIAEKSDIAEMIPTLARKNNIGFNYWVFKT